MKRALKGMLLAFMVAFALVLVPDMAKAEVTTGTLGNSNGISWFYDSETETLTVSGEETDFHGEYCNSPFSSIPYQFKKIEFSNCKLIGNASYLFSNLYNVTDIDFSGLDTSKVTNLEHSFEYLGSMRELDLSSLDTSSVVKFNNMFYYSEGIESIDVSKFDTSSAEDMTDMFNGCFHLESIDLSGFKTSKVTSFSGFFKNCAALKSVDLSGFDTSKAETMGAMFSECKNLVSLDLRSFNTEKVTGMDNMFFMCENLKELDMSSFTISNETYTYGIFGACTGLELIKLPKTITTTEEIREVYGCGELYNKEFDRVDKITPADAGQVFARIEYFLKIDKLALSGRTDRTITLKWNKNTSADEIEIWMYKKDGWAKLDTVSGDATSYKVSGLSPAVKYGFKVKATAMKDTTKYEGEEAKIYIKTLPAGITGLVCSKYTQNSITLKWNKTASALKYEVWMYKSGAWSRIYTTADNSELSYTVKGLKPSIRYGFKVRAIAMDGNVKLNGATTDIKQYTRPTNVSGFKYSKRTYNTVTLNWTKNTSADGYTVSQFKGGKWVEIYNAGKSVTNYTVKKLNPSVKYFFRIAAYKLDGNTKIYSTAFSNATVTTPPSNVAGFTYKTKGTNYITLKWNKNTSADGYQIQQYKGGKWVAIKNISGNGTFEYKVSGLKKATNYGFKIRACKMVGSAKLYGDLVRKDIRTN